MESEKANHKKKIQARTRGMKRQPDNQPKLELEKTPINFKYMRIAISFLAIENIPLSKSPNLLVMLEKYGVSLSNSYRDKHAAHDLLDCLASILEDNLMANLKKKSFIGTQIDEVTDTSKESI